MGFIQAVLEMRGMGEPPPLVLTPLCCLKWHLHQLFV